jgi:hypothetical protein
MVRKTNNILLKLRKMNKFIIIDNCLYKLNKKYLKKLNALSSGELEKACSRGNKTIRTESDALILLLIEIAENCVNYGDIYGTYNI